MKVEPYKKKSSDLVKNLGLIPSTRISRTLTNSGFKDLIPFFWPSKMPVHKQASIYT